MTPESVTNHHSRTKNNIDLHDHIETDEYIEMAIERLKNIEELLIRLSIALETGNIFDAREDYIKAHYQYESIRPLILTFGDIDKKINVHAYDLPDSTDDFHFIGFHAVEYALFQEQDIARAFVENQKLLGRIKNLTHYTHHQNITPYELVAFVPVYLDHIMQNKIPGNENLYSGADLGEIFANIEGIHLVLNQLRDHLPPSFFAEFDKQEEGIWKLLEPYKQDDIYQPYHMLKNSDKQLLTTEVALLAQFLKNLNQLILESIQNKNINH